MYNESYDEYIRNVLGYPNYSSYNDYDNYNIQPYNSYVFGENNLYRQEQNRNAEIEDWYPEIYKIIYPMVKKSCRNIEGKITKERINQIEEELYSNFEGNDEIYLNINLNNDIASQTRNATSKKIESMNTDISGKDNKTENRSESRLCNNCNNGGVRDIIRILLLRELLGGNNRPNNRPPFPPLPGPRPPFFPNGQGRPPFPRGYEDIYEY